MIGLRALAENLWSLFALRGCEVEVSEVFG